MTFFNLRPDPDYDCHKFDAKELLLNFGSSIKQLLPYSDFSDEGIFEYLSQQNIPQPTGKVYLG